MLFLNLNLKKSVGSSRSENLIKVLLLHLCYTVVTLLFGKTPFDSNNTRRTLEEHSKKTTLKVMFTGNSFGNWDGNLKLHSQ